MPADDEMTADERRKYIKLRAGQYLAADRAERGKLLTETVELVNWLAKSYLGWRSHRLRHPPGLDVLGQFVFAGLNFASWPADTIWAESGPEAGEIPGLAAPTQMARTPADVLSDGGGVVILLRPDGGWPHRSLRLVALRQPPLPGFAWSGIPIDAQGPLQDSIPDLVARKLG